MIFPKSPHPDRPIFVQPGATDMRKQINGLAVMVQNSIGQNPFDGACFMFCNRRRTTIKILYWEDSGFCLWTKRLEEQRFPWPKNEGEVSRITEDQLSLLLRGIDFWKAHRKLSYRKVSWRRLTISRPRWW